MIRSPSLRRRGRMDDCLPKWDEIAELVKMPGGIVAATLFDGTTVEITNAELRLILLLAGIA